MRLAFHTFGCKLNQYETESLAFSFDSPEFSLVSFDRQAELYIINTCSVTSKSEQKARGLIRRVSRMYPGSLIIVTGCYAQVDRESVSVLGPNVVVVPQEDKTVLHDFSRFLREEQNLKIFEHREKRGIFREFMREQLQKPGNPFRYHVNRFRFHSRAFLKVQDGCDYRCSYCIIPRARGLSVSLDPESIVQRIQSLEERGYREVVLTGVNLCSYKHRDLSLPDLLQMVLSATDRVRVRLSSLEPDRIDASLQSALAAQRICPHFHIPVQSGSDRILHLMKRRYTRKKLLEAVGLIREVKPEAFIAGDFIVGFPGEEERDFDLTLETIERLRLAKLHVFPFSRRPGTEASGWSDSIPGHIKKSRVRRLLVLSESLLKEYIGSWEGRSVEAVLEDECDADGNWRGLSENYLKLLIRRIPCNQAMSGGLVSCLIERAGVPARATFLKFIS